MKIGIIVLLLFPAALQAQVGYTLKECREMALTNSQEIAVAGKQQQKAIFETKAVRAAYLPKLSLSAVGFYHQKKYEYKLKGGYLPTYRPGTDGQLEPNLVIDPATQQPVIGADGNPVFSEYAFLPDIKLQLNLRGVYLGGAQLEQPLYMGGKIRAAHHVAKAGEEIAGENVRLNRAGIIIETDQAYWQLLRAEEQQVAARKYLEVVRELLKNMTDARSVGMATENDVLKVQVRFNQAGLMLQKVQNGIVLSRMNLCRIIGLDLNTDLLLRDSLTDQVSPGIWQLDSAVTQRPDYNMLSGEVSLQQRRIALVRSDFLPQAGVLAGYGYGGGVRLNGQDEAAASFSAMATLKIPVFHWGEGRNKVRAARMDEEISRLNLDKAAEEMRLEIVSARFNVQDALTRIEMARNALAQATENMRISNDQYQVGMENLTNLLEAQAQWQQMWSQWIDAKTMLHLSESQYLKAIGKLEQE